jgi:argininosuccinate lyase
MLATDLADYLVARGVPFRQAHTLVGQIVRRAGELGVRLDQMPLAEMRSISPAIGEDVAAVFDFQASVARRTVAGGTGYEAVKAQLAQAKAYLSEVKSQS